MIALTGAASARGEAGSIDDAVAGARSWLARQSVEDSPIASALAARALGDPVAIARLVAAQHPDGTWGRPADLTATWLSLGALAALESTPARAAAARAREALARTSRSDADAIGAGDPGIDRALSFLRSTRSNAPRGHVHLEAERWATIAGRRIDRRAEYARLLEGVLESSRPRSEREFGALHDLWLAAEILADFRNPRLRVRGRDVHWPELILQRVEAHHAEDGGFGRSPGEPPDVPSTCLALLVLDTIRPWLTVRLDEVDRAATAEPRKIATLTSDCEGCHRRLQPDLVHAWEISAHSRAEVGCASCHGSNHSRHFRENGAVSARVCGECHSRAVREFAASHHARAMDTLTSSALYRATRPAYRRACEMCHDVGRRHLDGSIGGCHHCHSGHDFDATRARDPAACGVCHTGDDYPQDLAYRLSKHGQIWNATRDELLAPTCATCHHPDGSHDDRFGLTLGGSGRGAVLAPQVAPVPMPTISPAEFAERRAEMVSVCARCHSSRFAETNLAAADDVKRTSDDILRDASRLVRDLHAEGLVGQPGEDLVLGGEQLPVAFDVPGGRVLDAFYDLWRFDHAWSWKGAYHQSPSVANLESRPDLARRFEELRRLARELRREAR